MTAKKVNATTINTTAELREFLANQIPLLATNEITHQQARGMASLAQQVHNSLRLEVDVARFVSESAALEQNSVGVTAIKPLSITGK